MHDLALAMHDEGIVGPGWVWVSNVIQKDDIANGFGGGGAGGGDATKSRSGRSADVWKALQYIVQVHRLSNSAVARMFGILLMVRDRWTTSFPAITPSRSSFARGWCRI